MKFSSRFKWRLPALILCGLMVLSFLANLSIAQQGTGGIGVANDGPSFLDISIAETESVTFINVEIRDLNGWNDIFSINVTVFDDRDNPLCQVSYMQYPNLGSTSVAAIIWNETVGNYLDVTQSTWDPFEVAPWNPDNAVMEIGLRVSFAFVKFSGNSIHILGMDKYQLTCEYSGPFSAEYTPAPQWENVAIPVSLSTTVAVGTGLFMVYRRFKNNKLARAVEASHASVGED